MIESERTSVVPAGPRTVVGGPGYHALGSFG